MMIGSYPSICFCHSKTKGVVNNCLYSYSCVGCGKLMHATPLSMHGTPRRTCLSCEFNLGLQQLTISGPQQLIIEKISERKSTSEFFTEYAKDIQSVYFKNLKFLKVMNMYEPQLVQYHHYRRFQYDFLLHKIIIDTKVIILARNFLDVIRKYKLNGSIKLKYKKFNVKGHSLTDKNAKILQIKSLPKFLETFKYDNVFIDFTGIEKDEMIIDPQGDRIVGVHINYFPSLIDRLSQDKLEFEYQRLLDTMDDLLLPHSDMRKASEDATNPFFIIKDLDLNSSSTNYLSDFFKIVFVYLNRGKKKTSELLCDRSGNIYLSHRKSEIMVIPVGEHSPKNLIKSVKFHLNILIFLLRSYHRRRKLTITKTKSTRNRSVRHTSKKSSKSNSNIRMKHVGDYEKSQELNSTKKIKYKYQIKVNTHFRLYYYCKVCNLRYYITEIYMSCPHCNENNLKDAKRCDNCENTLMKVNCKNGHPLKFKIKKVKIQEYIKLEDLPEDPRDIFLTE